MNLLADSFVLQTMSDTHWTTMVPVLDSSNYRDWALSMKSQLRAKGVWQVVNGQITCPVTLAPTATNATAVAANVKEQQEWDIKDDMAIGLIQMRMASHLGHHSAEVPNANDPAAPPTDITSRILWDQLVTAYSTPMKAILFQDYMATIGFHLNKSMHPGAQINMLHTVYEHLTVNNIPIPEELQAMCLINSASTVYDNVASNLLTTNIATPLMMKAVTEAIIAEYKHKHASSSGQSLNKMSNIARKDKEPVHKPQPKQQGASSSKPQQQSLKSSTMQRGR